MAHREVVFVVLVLRIRTEELRARAKNQQGHFFFLWLGRIIPLLVYT
jgi:hypothetical protein